MVENLNNEWLSLFLHMYTLIIVEIKSSIFAVIFSKYCEITVLYTHFTFYVKKKI